MIKCSGLLLQKVSQSVSNFPLKFANNIKYSSKTDARVRSYKTDFTPKRGLELNSTNYVALALVVKSFFPVPVLFIEQTPNPLYLETGLQSPLFCTQHFRVQMNRASVLLSRGSDSMAKVAAATYQDLTYGFRPVVARNL